MSIEDIKQKTDEFIKCGFSQVRKAIAEKKWGILIDKHGFGGNGD